MIHRTAAAVFALLVLAIGTPARAGETPRNLFLVVINGVRSSECFGFDPGDDEHPNIPNMWNLLRPQSTLLTNHWNVHYTKSVAPLNTVLTGVPHVSANRGTPGDPRGWRNVRSRHPNLFEYAIRDLGLDASQLVYISNKYNMDVSEHGWHPLYGENYRPGTVLFIDPDEYPYRDDDGFRFDDNPDDVAFEAFKKITEFDQNRPPEDYPRFVYLGLGTVDAPAHQGFPGMHRLAIQNADDIIGQLRFYVISHPHYFRDTTVMVLTPHGRRTQDTGGYRNHTGGDVGSRQCFTLIFGPHTPQGVEVTRFTTMEDLAPTIGTLLGIDTPRSRGDAIHEALEETREEVRRDTIRDLAVTVSNNRLFAAYRRSVDSEVDVVFQRGQATGTDVLWDTPVGLTGAASEDLFAEQPTVALLEDDLTVGVAWVQRDTPAGLWNVRYVSSPDRGVTFGSPTTVFTEVVQDIDGVGYRLPRQPHLVGGAPTPHLLLPIYGAAAEGDTLSLFRTTDDFATPSSEIEVLRAGGRGAFPRDVEASLDDHGFLRTVLVRGDLPLGTVNRQFNREVFFRRFDTRVDGLTSPGSTATRTFRLPTSAERLTASSTPSIQTCLAVDPSDEEHIAVAWAELSIDNGLWQVFVQESTDGGRSWLPRVAATDALQGAWEPAIVFDGLGRLHIAYVDFSSGEGDIFHKVLETDGTLSPPVAVAVTPEVSGSPKIVNTGSKGPVVVWIENDELAAAQIE